ncbi:hypothetical protein DFH11DRAFT_1603973 [Phellopilus nigrolimitatus]|nr:hypothetical protein DFH11DRAFT_1603973 [Phellopilus nigrolimitatus]
MVTTPSVRTPLLALELKAELGSGDAILQAAGSYVKCVMDRSFADFWKKSCCPMILIAMMGPFLCVMGAIFLDRPVIEPLTDMILYMDQPEDAGERIGTLARLLQALKNAHDRLNTYYTSFEPRLRSYVSEGSTFTFSFDEPVSENKLLWYATSEQTRERLVIKFTKHYDIASHELLSEAGYAPHLYYADPPSGSKDWRMIVMKYIPSRSLHDTSAEERPFLRQDIHNAIALLHEDGRVFGDLRLANVLISKSEAGRPRAMLIDFDWSGKEGVARYPYDRNDVDILWSEGSKPGGTIQRSHDIYFLDGLDQTFS